MFELSAARLLYALGAWVWRRTFLCQNNLHKKVRMQGTISIKRRGTVSTLAVIDFPPAYR